MNTLESYLQTLVCFFRLFVFLQKKESMSIKVCFFKGFEGQSVREHRQGALRIRIATLIIIYNNFSS